MQEVTSRHLSEIQKLWSDMGYDSQQLDARMVIAFLYFEYAISSHQFTIPSYRTIRMKITLIFIGNCQDIY